MVIRRSGSRGASQTSGAAPRSMATRLNEPKAKLTDLAYQMIEEAIVTLRIRPGTSLSEQALSEMTGIGRTPIREAIQRLAREHLILRQRGGGGEGAMVTAGGGCDSLWERSSDRDAAAAVRRLRSTPLPTNSCVERQPKAGVAHSRRPRWTKKSPLVSGLSLCSGTALTSSLRKPAPQWPRLRPAPRLHRQPALRPRRRPSVRRSWRPTCCPCRPRRG